ncbi:hypothetical protein ACHAPT_010070 [Fusarium lateritium]
MTPRPLFFLIRPGLEQITSNGRILVQPGKAVPLIPVDLLPEWMEVIGLPRCLSQEQAEGMENLGVYHAETETYQLKFDPLAEDNESSDDGSTSYPSKTEPSTSPPPPPPSEIGDSDEKAKPTAPAPKKLKPAQGLASSRHNPLNNSQALEHTTTTSPTPVLTSPCRHWCRYGACKWGLSCRFRHAMPMTLEGLAQVGLESFPDWWLQARGVMPMPPEVIRAAEPRRPVVKKQKKHKVVYQRQGGDCGDCGQRMVSRPVVESSVVGEVTDRQRAEAAEGILIEI